MRAIIRGHSNADRAQWIQVLRYCEWWPGIDQADEVITEKRDQILNLVPEEDRIVVQKTYWFTIHNSKKKTWCIVNSPQDNEIEFRLRNHSSPLLQEACEHLISKILGYFTNSGTSVGLEFEFEKTIEVLEPTSQHLAYYGEVLPREKWKLARAERRQEWMLAKCSLLCGFLLAVSTIPPAESMLLTSIVANWRQWIDGNLGRLSTSVLVTALVSGFAVLSHYFELRRDGSIRWLIKAA